jgi:hypothetical protein
MPGKEPDAKANRGSRMPIATSTVRMIIRLYGGVDHQPAETQRAVSWSIGMFLLGWASRIRCGAYVPCRDFESALSQKWYVRLNWPY